MVYFFVCLIEVTYEIVLKAGLMTQPEAHSSVNFLNTPQIVQMAYFTMVLFHSIERRKQKIMYHKLNGFYYIRCPVKNNLIK